MSTVLQLQRKAEALVDKLHYINCDVHGAFGEPDRDTIEATLHELLVDLPELKASASNRSGCAVAAAALATVGGSRERARSGALQACMRVCLCMGVRIRIFESWWSAVRSHWCTRGRRRRRHRRPVAFW